MQFQIAKLVWIVMEQQNNRTTKFWASWASWKRAALEQLLRPMALRFTWVTEKPASPDRRFRGWRWCGVVGRRSVENVDRQTYHVLLYKILYTHSENKAIDWLIHYHYQYHQSLSDIFRYYPNSSNLVEMGGSSWGFQKYLLAPWSSGPHKDACLSCTWGEKRWGKWVVSGQGLYLVCWACCDCCNCNSPVPCLFHVCSMFVPCMWHVFLFLILLLWGFWGIVGHKIHRSIMFVSITELLLLSFMLVISCQDCQKNRTCHRCVHSLSWYSWSWHVLYWRCFVCYSDVVFRFWRTMHVLCTHSYSVLIIVCFSLVFHIVFALGSLDARVPVRLPVFVSSSMFFCFSCVNIFRRYLCSTVWAFVTGLLSLSGMMGRL